MRVRAELGLALKMASGGGFNFFKPLISIDDIDPDGDVTAQIKLGVKALKEAWAATEAEMITIVETSELVDKESVVLEIRKQMAEFEERMITVEQASAVAKPVEEMTWDISPKKTPKKRKTAAAKK